MFSGKFYRIQGFFVIESQWFHYMRTAGVRWDTVMVWEAVLIPSSLMHEDIIRIPYILKYARGKSYNFIVIILCRKISVQWAPAQRLEDIFSPNHLHQATITRRVVWEEVQSKKQPFWIAILDYIQNLISSSFDDVWY